jgi:PKD repeat protein
LARRAFFAFHYERDIWRAGQVRNSWVAKPDRETAGFWDAADWERVKRQGDDAIKRWIKDQLNGTSVTVVLIGYETAKRDWVKFEIIESYKKGNGLLGIYIHNLKDTDGNTDYKGDNPFDHIYIERDGREVYFSELYPNYDWVNDNGYSNIGSWIETAAKKAGK